MYSYLGAINNLGKTSGVEPRQTQEKKKKIVKIVEEFKKPLKLKKIEIEQEEVKTLMRFFCNCNNENFSPDLSSGYAASFKAFEAHHKNFFDNIAGYVEFEKRYKDLRDHDSIIHYEKTFHILKKIKDSIYPYKNCDLSLESTTITLIRKAIKTKLNELNILLKTYNPDSKNYDKIFIFHISFRDEIHKIFEKRIRQLDQLLEEVREEISLTIINKFKQQLQMIDVKFPQDNFSVCEKYIIKLERIFGEIINLIRSKNINKNFKNIIRNKIIKLMSLLEENNFKIYEESLIKYIKEFYNFIREVNKIKVKEISFFVNIYFFPGCQLENFKVVKNEKNIKDKESIISHFMPLVLSKKEENQGFYSSEKKEQFKSIFNYFIDLFSQEKKDNQDNEVRSLKKEKQKLMEFIQNEMTFEQQNEFSEALSKFAFPAEYGDIPKQFNDLNTVKKLFEAAEKIQIKSNCSTPKTLLYAAISVADQEKIINFSNHKIYIQSAPVEILDFIFFRLVKDSNNILAQTSAKELLVKRVDIMNPRFMQEFFALFVSNKEFHDNYEVIFPYLFQLYISSQKDKKNDISTSLIQFLSIAMNERKNGVVNLLLENIYSSLLLSDDLKKTYEKLKNLEQENFLLFEEYPEIKSSLARTVIKNNLSFIYNKENKNFLHNLLDDLKNSFSKERLELVIERYENYKNNKSFSKLHWSLSCLTSRESLRLLQAMKNAMEKNNANVISESAIEYMKDHVHDRTLAKTLRDVMLMDNKEVDYALKKEKVVNQLSNLARRPRLSCFNFFVNSCYPKIEEVKETLSSKKGNSRGSI